MVEINYDKKHDILYIRLKDTSDSYGVEDPNGVITLKDIGSDAITGITIMDISKYFKKVKF